LQKPNLKIKVEYVEKQVDLQNFNLKIKVEHVEEQKDLQKPILNIKVKKLSKTYIIDQISTTKDSKNT
jgi:hypothetical protein